MDRNHMDGKVLLLETRVLETAKGEKTWQANFQREDTEYQAFQRSVQNRD